MAVNPGKAGTRYAAGLLIVVVAVTGAWLIVRIASRSSPIDRPAAFRASGEFIGSASCRECHEHFYQLWAPSHHGLAMQPFSVGLAATRLTQQVTAIEIGGYRYRAEIGAEGGIVREEGPDGSEEFRIEYALGGKNIFFFLTPMERGRLQVLPVAYDIGEGIWYDTTASMVRHAARSAEEILDWRDPLLTFNTSCYGCHVSQLSTNYDPVTDTYRTTWTEPGINCETCHGGAREHVRVFREAPGNRPPEDPEIISLGSFAHEQMNDVCAPCHAKMTPLTTTFRPGERYFDHYTLAAFENPDFYPDGRDLGENYTYTLWLTSPCVGSGRLDCMHCHTSSGRYLFVERPNDACLPCHQEQVADAAAHSHHPADDLSSRCVSCHMPRTEFARIRRTDHSMRPPTPSVTMAYGSPNACNLCHADRDAAWADRYVRQWRSHDYQAPVLYRAGLIDAARREDWTRLDEMLAWLVGEDRDAVFAVSLIRLLRTCDEERKWPVIVSMLTDPSPLVRASAAGSLHENLTPGMVEALVEATRDGYRLVRIRAAESLAGIPTRTLDARARRDVERATAELEASWQVRPDDHTSHFNLGNFYLDRGDITRAIASFETAIRLRPDTVRPLINASIAYVRGGRADLSEESLRRALQMEPDHPVANLNLGLLLAEQGRMQEAEIVLRTALESDPDLAAAAYNLGLILTPDRVNETLDLCRRAYELQPDEPRYAYSFAFYLDRTGRQEAAVPILERMVDRQVAHAGAYHLLGAILERGGRTGDAVEVYRKAVANRRLSQADRAEFEARIPP